MNTVGLQRAGFSTDAIASLKRMFRLLYRSGLKQEEALNRILAQHPTPEAEYLVEFIRRSKRGICRPANS